MLYSEIDIPVRIHVPDTEMPLLEDFAGRYNESVETYMSSSIELVATWGEIVERCGYSKKLMHGLGNLDAGTFEPIDIPSMLSNQEANFTKSKNVAAEMGLKLSEIELLDSITEFQICRDSVTYLRICCGFFGFEPKPLISLATLVRDDILQRQKRGEIYTYTADGCEWNDIFLPTFPKLD